MALLFTQKKAITDTQNIAYIEPSTINRETGMQTLHAHYDSSGEEFGLQLEIFTGPPEQMDIVSTEIGDHWFDGGWYAVPESRPHTLKEEKTLFHSIFSDGKRRLHLFQEKAYRFLIIRSYKEKIKFDIYKNHPIIWDEIYAHLENVANYDNRKIRDIIIAIKEEML